MKGRCFPKQKPWINTRLALRERMGDKGYRTQGYRRGYGYNPEATAEERNKCKKSRYTKYQKDYKVE